MINEQESNSETYYERSRKPLITIPKSRLGKVGCGIALVFWFLLLMLPCAMFALARNGEFRLDHANMPASEAHPLVQIKLIMDSRNRGLQILRSSIVSEDEMTNVLCVQSNVDYFLWQTRDESDSSAVYCDCYRPLPETNDWELISTISQECESQ